jgi:hypothetical protein
MKPRNNNSINNRKKEMFYSKIPKIYLFLSKPVNKIVGI